MEQKSYRGFIAGEVGSKLRSQLVDAFLAIDDNEPEGVKLEAFKFISNGKSSDKFLQSSRTGESVNLESAFAGVVGNQPESDVDWFEDLEDGTPPVNVAVIANYDVPGDFFWLVLGGQRVRIRQIRFTGKLFIRETKLFQKNAAQYRIVGDDSVVSEVVTYEPMMFQAGD